MADLGQLALDFTARVSPTQAAVEAWLRRNAPTIHSWEGEVTEEHGLDSWLPGYNSGVYIVGEYVRDCSDCEGCDRTPFGFRTCRPRVKIGIASDMYMRFANLKCGSSRELEVLALMPFPKDDRRVVERELHRIFATYRIDSGRKTEWYWNNEALEDLVCEVHSFGAEPSW